VTTTNVRVPGAMVRGPGGVQHRRAEVDVLVDAIVVRPRGRQPEFRVEGVVAEVGAASWTLATPDGEWSVQRGGCGCGGAITPL
jgi:hypothetical protein